MRGLAAALALALCATAFAAQDAPLGTRQLRAVQGEALYRTHCIGCHGPEAAGCGTSARLYKPRPANLTRSTRDEAYRMSIIRNGGESMGRSPFMPPWVGALDDDDIRNVVAFLATLQPKDTPTC